MRLASLWLSLFCVVGLLAFPSGSLASRRTTQPGSTIRVFVTVTDKGITYTAFEEMSTGGQTGLIPARGGGIRGDVAIFRVRNRGKKPHNFVLLGKKTGRISPGRTSSFAVLLLRRGSFPFESTLDKGKRGFRGIFVVR